MSNKLPKNKKTYASGENKKDFNMKTFFSFNPVGNKVYSLYEDSKKREATVTRHGINSVISMVIIMMLLTVWGYAEMTQTVVYATILFGVLELLISIWNVYKGKNRTTWIFSIAVSAIFIIANIVILIL